MMTRQFGLPSYLLTGTLAVMLSWVMTFSGCRLGNREEGGGLPPGNPGARVPEGKELFTGYYKTTATRVNFCALYKTRSETDQEIERVNCVEINNENLPGLRTVAERVPTFTASVMTDPFLFLAKSATSAEGYMINGIRKNEDLNNLPRFNINIGHAGKLAHSGQISNYNPITLWEDPNCAAAPGLELKGQLLPDGEPEPDMLADEGRFAGNLLVYTVTTKDCTNATYVSMAACFKDPAACPADAPGVDWQQLARDYYEPWAELGVIEFDNMSNFLFRFYEVSYE